MGCSTCGGKSSASKSKSSMPSNMSGRSKPKTYASSMSGTSTYGKPKITFSGRGR